MESVGIDMLNLIINDGAHGNITKDFVNGIKVAKSIMEDEGYFNLSDWEMMSEEEQREQVMCYLSMVDHDENKKRENLKKEISFDWSMFSEKDFARLQREQNPDIYGCIRVTCDAKTYLVDIEWETKYTYGRDGFSINVYESEPINLNHDYLLEEIKKINYSKTYERFKKRAEKLILDFLLENC